MSAISGNAAKLSHRMLARDLIVTHIEATGDAHASRPSLDQRSGTVSPSGPMICRDPAGHGPSHPFARSFPEAAQRFRSSAATRPRKRTEPVAKARPRFAHRSRWYRLTGLHPG